MSLIMTATGWKQLAPSKVHVHTEDVYPLRPWDPLYDRSKDPRFAPILPKFFPGTYKNEMVQKAMNDRRCVTCKGVVLQFKDALSEKEFEISGCCQKCQDKFLGG